VRRRRAGGARLAAADPAEVEILVDGRPVRALAGQSVAGALHQAGVDLLRRNPVTGELRGAFCGMGVCFECELTIDGVPGSRACMAHVSAGLRIDTEEHSAAG
jgi:predicted molibdopterin-dependent oxidoreductase YjgC